MPEPSEAQGRKGDGDPEHDRKHNAADQPYRVGLVIVVDQHARHQSRRRHEGSLCQAHDPPDTGDNDEGQEYEGKRESLGGQPDPVTADYSAPTNSQSRARRTRRSGARRRQPGMVGRAAKDAA